MATIVHQTAVVEAGAQLGRDVFVGPFCHVGSDVTLGDETRLLSHAVVLGPTEMGARNVVHPFATVGAPPQDKSWTGQPTRLVMGEENVVREQVSIHRGTEKGGGRTRIGSHCLFMVGAHVAHDCTIGDGVTLVNLATLGGHVTVHDRAVLGGHVAVAPFGRLGRLSFLAGGARVEGDVPPFVIAAGDRARVRSLNSVGLRRGGAPDSSRKMLVRAFRMLFRSEQPRSLALPVVKRELGTDPWVRQLVEFLEASP